MEATNFVYLIKQLDMALRPRFFALCAEAGLSASQYTALTVLRSRPGITSSELARRSFVRAQTMAATVDPLLALGYLRRERSAAHRRHILLYLTAAGSAKIAEVEPRMRALEELLTAELAPREVEDFAELLRRTRRTMDAVGRDGVSAEDGTGLER